jgi:hypothetical protein
MGEGEGEGEYDVAWDGVQRSGDGHPELAGPRLLDQFFGSSVGLLTSGMVCFIQMILEQKRRIEQGITHLVHGFDEFGQGLSGDSR